MSTLLLRLAGPLQSWGHNSRFTRRTTDRAPSKSGVIGLLAAARGLRRSDPLEDLLNLSFGVRVDQPGRIERDFQTARRANGTAFPLTHRFYLSDAVFVAAIEGDGDLIRSLDEAIRAPAFPLYLGRRSCPPAGPLTLGVHEGSVWSALNVAPWQASTWWRRKQSLTVSLELRVDSACVPDDAPRKASMTRETTHDAPISFDPERRQYGWREVTRTQIDVENSVGREQARLGHDPFALLGGA